MSTKWRECPDCGEYQTVHPGPCPHCGSTTICIRDDDETDESKSVFWNKSHPERQTGKNSIHEDSVVSVSEGVEDPDGPMGPLVRAFHRLLNEGIQ